MGSRLDKNSNDVRKRIAGHTFTAEDGEEYSASKFGGFSDYMRRKKIKLQNLDAELRSQSEKPQIFRNIVAHVNGYTQPSLNDLHVMIVEHGGGFMQYLDGKTMVTHVIASQLTPKKKVEFAKYRIVKPAWVVDSVHAGRLLPWENYRVVDEGVTQKVLGFGNGQMVSQSSKSRQGYKDQTETSWYTSQVKDISDKLNAEHDEVDVTQSLANSSFTFSQQLCDDDLLGAELMDESAPNPVHHPVAGSPVNTSLPKPLHEPTLQSHPVDRSANTILPTTTDPVQAINAKPETPKSREKKPLTAEEHNAILLSNPHMAKSSTANPDFINQYYRESRLHHLSSWKAELKAQLQARAQESSSQRKQPKRPSGSRRYIMHVDFDSFFAAVSLRKNPQLKDKPVVVAHGSGPGSEIASCNYPARTFGVKNGMWMKHALELCSDLKVLPYDYAAYEEASKHFYDSILAMDGIVQSISIDEALIDISEQCIAAGGSDGKAVSEGSIYREQTKASELGVALRDTIRAKTGCDVSVGLGGNILLAKVALRKAKPAGQHLIRPEDVLSFMGELAVTDLPGVAYSLGNKLEHIGVKLVKDIREMTKEKLVNTLGPKTGNKLWDYSRGIDKQEVGEQVVRKSVSAEVNWGIRFINQQQAEEFVYALCEELSKRLLEQLVKGKQFTMKIMRKAADAGMDPPKNLGHGKCDTFSKTIMLGVATNDKMVMGKEAVAILRGYAFPPGELRGLGVQMQKLEPLKPAATSETSAWDSSQRKLQFKKPVSDKTNDAAHKATIPSIASNRALETKKATSSSSIPQPAPETADEVKTPEKSRIASDRNIMSFAASESETPLNVGGTQFAIPSQVDPSVLAELPPDIRKMLVPHSLRRLDNTLEQESASESARSRSQSPFVSDTEVALPNASQLDPDTLAALPDDVREEILSEYKRGSISGMHARMQQVLPQSPRKKRTLPTKKATTPKKKQKTISLLTRGRQKSAKDTGLVQSNFSFTKTTNLAAEFKGQNNEVSATFLEELPEDIRSEILAEQRRDRIQRSGLDVAAPKRKPKAIELPKGQTTLPLPKREPKPTFTSRKLSTLGELRDAMSSWVQAFSSDGETGPYEEDTNSLAVYLERVILLEGDMSKAQSIVEWLAYVVRDWPFETDEIKEAWQSTIILLKAHIQQAIKTRGLPPLAFSE